MSTIQVANVKLKDAHTRIDIPVAGSLAFTSNSANALYISNSLVTIPGARDLVLDTSLEVTGNIISMSDRLQSNSFTVIPSLLLGGANTGMTYSTRSAIVVIGPHQVTILGRVILTAKGSSVGTAVINHYGLPALANTGIVSCHTGYYSGFQANIARPWGYVNVPVSGNTAWNLVYNDQITITNSSLTDTMDVLYFIRYNRN